MKLVLPNNHKITLPGSKTYQERKEIIDLIAEEYNTYFIEYWDSPRARTCLDIMATYLSRAEDFRKDNSNPVLSRRKQRDLERGDMQVVHFSELARSYRLMLGLVDIDDDCE